MQNATLAIAVLGLVLSALSLGWQAATFVLTGGRVKAELLLGATGGAGIVTIPLASVTRDTPAMLQSQGFTHPIAAVRVRNIGRLRVRITAWSLTTTKGGISLSPVGLSIGPPLPHWLEAGDTELWATDLAAVHGLMHTTASVLKIPLERMGVRATVDLGSGRAVKARGTIR